MLHMSIHWWLVSVTIVTRRGDSNLMRGSGDACCTSELKRPLPRATVSWLLQKHLVPRWRWEGANGFGGQKPPEVISFHSVRLLLAGESHRKSYSDVARPTVVPSVGMIAQVLYNHG